MKTITTKFSTLLLLAVFAAACNSNQGKGNDTTGAGTEQYDDVNAPSESRTPSSSMTNDSSGAVSPAAENPAMGSDTATTTGPDPRER